MARRVPTAPHASTPEAAEAYRTWSDHWEAVFRMRGYREEAAQRKVASLLVSHVAWDRRPGLVSEHALAAGLVDPVKLERHRAASKRHRRG